MQPGILGPRKHGCASGSCPCGFSKWPISLVYEMLYVWAVHSAHARGWPDRVGGAAVENMGWNAYGAPLQVKCAGSHRMCRNPLRTLATIRPDRPVVRSAIVVSSPARVSWMCTRSRSPPFMSSTSGVTVKLCVVWVSGPGGPTGCPSCVRKAKFTGSVQFGLVVVKLPCKLSIVSAAHHCVPPLVQEMAVFQPGGYSCSSMYAAPAWVGVGTACRLVSLSGRHTRVPSG